MIVDIHCHLAPPDAPGAPALKDVDAFLERKAADGIDLSVVVHGMITIPGLPVLDYVKWWNEFALGVLRAGGHILSTTESAAFWVRRNGGLDPHWTLDNYVKFFTRPYLVTALTNSVEVTLITTALSVLLCFQYARRKFFTRDPNHLGVDPSQAHGAN